MSPQPAIVWFRRDLRLEDNPALTEAVDRGGPLIPVFIWAPGEAGSWPPGSASRWWLHQSLKDLDRKLNSLGSRLIFRIGPSEEALQSLINKTGASGVFWNRLYEPALANRDREIERKLQGQVSVETFNGSLLFEPGDIRTRQGDPYRVFTPFWKNCRSREQPREPLPTPSKWRAPKAWPSSVGLKALQLEPEIDWAGGLRETWTPGEAGAEQRLVRFLDRALSDYQRSRDVPGRRGTSELSPHLHFGEISPWHIWHAVRDVAGDDLRTSAGKSGQTYLAELGWREFSHHVLSNFPETSDAPLHKKFENFPWNENPEGLKVWQRGLTGVPIVDAGMRQLWETGWIHNRVRMIVASFLTKDLRINWREGAKWFWDTLVDADLANNTMGWQWSAGCGADAAPYFRIFNPVSQGEKFDPQGNYVRRYVPELRALPDCWIHRPWEAPATVLQDGNDRLGKTYPEPLVDHAHARKAALAAFAEIKS